MSLPKVFCMPPRKVFPKQCLVVVGAATDPNVSQDDWNNKKQCPTDDLLELSRRFPNLDIVCYDVKYPHYKDVSDRIQFKKEKFSLSQDPYDEYNCNITDFDTHYVVISFSGGLSNPYWTSVEKVVERFDKFDKISQFNVSYIEYGCGWSNGFNTKLIETCFSSGILTPTVPSVGSIQVAFRNAIDIQDIGLSLKEIIPFLYGQFCFIGAPMHLMKDGGMVELWTKFILESGMLEECSTPELLVDELPCCILSDVVNWASLSYNTRSCLTSFIFGTTNVEFDNFYSSQYS